MTDQPLYTHACEMLETTNVFSKPADALNYKGPRGDTVSLLSLVRDDPKINSRRMSSDLRRGGYKNNLACFEAICGAMASYAGSYPAPPSFKGWMREKFMRWLYAIQSEYGIRDADVSIPDALFPAEGERDTAVTLLKSLQERGGLTKGELRDELGIGTRGVLKALCKLDPTLGKTDRQNTGSEEKRPFYIGGHPVQAKIRAIKKRGKREHLYMTVNTVHPLILQENLMQAGTLLLALARNWRYYENNLSLYIGLDIWLQLTAYAKERICEVFPSAEPAFLEFIRELDNMTPDDQALQAFQTEREIADNENYNLTFPDRLIYLSKARTRSCRTISIDTGDGEITLEDVRIEPVTDSDGKAGYLAVTDYRPAVFFLPDQVTDMD